MSTRLRAFTLIELLIVVAIIAILAAIAVPNFLEAQTRSKVSRVRSDLRTLATAIEAYSVDHNQYPPHMLVDQITGNEADPWIPNPPGGPFATAAGTQNEFHFSRRMGITSPIAYITNLPLDPFHVANKPIAEGSSILATARNPIIREYLYGNSPQGSANANTVAAFELVYGGWRVWSGGPDYGRRDIYLRNPTSDAMRIYDPTNGTISQGDIWRTQRSQEGDRPSVPGWVE
jgi:prepilin-type N-terminal cleavage/methylation domain-containing protein